MRCITVAVIFVLSCTLIEGITTSFEPKIDVFHPKGFHISIEDQPGIRLVAFHISLNRELSQNEVGDISKEIMYANNGQWTFENNDIHVKVGDKLWYWFYVIKDKIGYNSRPYGYSVTELKQRPSKNRHSLQSHANCMPCRNEEVETTTSTSLLGVEPTAYPQYCQTILLNVTQNFIKLQYQIEDIRKQNELLNSFIEKYPDAKKLKISGRIPDGEASMVAKFLIREKLDFDPDITRTIRNRDGSIDLELSTVIEKLKILDLAKNKLKNSNVAIS